MLDKINSKTLWGGTSGQTGNSWFFDFWGEYLEIFGGKSNFFPCQKVFHYWCPTKSFITADPQKPLLPPLWYSPHFPEIKNHHFRKSQVNETYLIQLAFAGSPTLVISGVSLSCFVCEILRPLIFCVKPLFFLGFYTFFAYISRTNCRRDMKFPVLDPLNNAG